jgi:hypothetical protein
MALRHGVFKPIGGRNDCVVGIEQGKAQTCKTEDSDADKLASSDATTSSGCGRGGIGSHGGGLLILINTTMYVSTVFMKSKSVL